MTKKHAVSICLVFLAAVLAIAPGPAVGGEPSHPLVFKLNHQFPADTPGSQLDQWFASQVEERTKGSVRIRIFWSNSLGEPRENLSLLKRGRIDLAAMSPGYFPDELPLLAAPNSIPMAMDNVCQASEIMDRFVKKIPAVTEEALANGFRPLFFHLLNPYLLVTKTPVKTLSELKGMRIRTWGNEMPELMRAAKASPVPLFLPDIYPAMKNGVIDGCPFSVDLVVSYKIHEIARHITEVVLWQGPSWALWISSRAWEKLSPDQQQIFLETAEQARQKEIQLTLASEKKARRFLLEQGVTFHPFPAKDLAAWKAGSPDFMQAFVDRSETLGKGGAAKEMTAIWQQLRKEITCP